MCFLFEIYKWLVCDYLTCQNLEFDFEYKNNVSKKNCYLFLWFIWQKYNCIPINLINPKDFQGNVDIERDSLG